MRSKGLGVTFPTHAQSTACNRRLVVSIFWPKVAGIVEISALKTKNWLFSTFFHRSLPHEKYFLTKKDTTAVGCALERPGSKVSNAQSAACNGRLVASIFWPEVAGIFEILALSGENRREIGFFL